MQQIDQFITRLQNLQFSPEENVFNPWRDPDEENDAPDVDGPAIRRENLRRYLLARLGKARLLVVAEAPGYNGCKFSGIAMTSERQLLLTPDRIRLAPSSLASQRVTSSRNPKGYTERTATIVWNALHKLAPESFVLWNAFPCHPHQTKCLLSNDTPNKSLVDRTKHVLHALQNIFPEAQLVAFGRVAQRLLPEAKQLRHPSNDYKKEFPAQISALLKTI